MNKLNLKTGKCILLIIFSLFGASCAHHETQVEHHHHEAKKVSYGGKCAYSVAHDQFDVEGNSEISLDHEGTTYYFSSQEKLKEFVKNLNEYIKTADRHWHDNSTRR